MQDNAGNAVALSVGNTSAAYSGTLSGPGSLVKVGTGVQTLAAANAYGGATTVNSGTLNMAAGGSIASTSQFSVATSTSNGVLTLNGGAVNANYNSDPSLVAGNTSSGQARSSSTPAP